jgi:hypothetical protein
VEPRTPNSELRTVGRLTLPIPRIHLELTSHCNFACEFCPDDLMTRRRGFMDFGLLLRLFDEISRENLAQWVALHVMGEPTLHPRVEEAVAEGAARGLALCLVTNGSLLTPEKAENLSRAGLKRLIVSVQTPDAESFNLRGAPHRLAFEEFADRIGRSVRRLCASPSGPSVVLSFLTTPLPGWLTPGSPPIRIADRNGALRERLLDWISKIFPEGVGPGVREAVARARIGRYNRIAVAPRLTFETRFLGDWGTHFRQRGRILPARFGSCNGLSENMGVLWNGDFVYCCTDFNGETSTRNAADASIREFLEEPEVQSIVEGFNRYRVVHPHCQRCLGDVTWSRSLVRQVGSIVYFKWMRKRMAPDGWALG